MGTGVQYVTLWVGVEYLRAAAAMASALGYVLGAVTNYVINRRFTFQSRAPHRQAVRKYVVAVSLGWGLNTALMALLAHALAWQYFVAQIVTTGVGLAWNFLASRYWVFREPK